VRKKANKERIIGFEKGVKPKKERAMSEEVPDRFELPKEVRSMAETGFEQARGAFEKFLAGAQRTAGSIEQRGAAARADAREISAKAISCAEKNIQTSLDYAEALLKARDLPDIMRLQRDYMQSQMRALAQQANEMGQIVGRLLLDTGQRRAEAQDQTKDTAI
jgi:phasin